MSLYRTMGSSLGGQYDPPPNYGIPNPLGPRVHNWRGGPLNEGSLYHGPVYTRPDYTLPWAPRPLFGVGQEDPEDVEEEEPSALGTILPILAIGGVLLILFWPSGGKK